jgi:RNA polymerase sigma-70 factor (ECF subfamily)
VTEVDGSLVERLRRGDATAFDEIYGRLAPRLFAFLARLTRRDAIAQELAQETWLRLATHGRDLPADVNLHAWIFTVARNLYRSYRRWHLVDLDRTRLLALFGSGRTAVQTPHDTAAASETGRRLEQVLAELPVAQREIMLLVAVEGFSPTDAAAIIGVRAETARQRLSRARTQIARRLQTGWTIGTPRRETS